MTRALSSTTNLSLRDKCTRRTATRDLTAEQVTLYLLENLATEAKFKYATRASAWGRKEEEDKLFSLD